MSDTLYIINPAGHGGAGLKAWEQFKALWGDEIDPEHVIVTERPGHAREIAASSDGYDILAAVGGDGTVGEVMSAIMEREGSKPGLAIIPAGTGNDIARNTGISSAADAVRSLRDRRPRGCDLIRIESQLDGRPIQNYAFLQACIGFSSIPMIKPWMKRLLGPAGAYYLATILQVIVYRSPSMTIRADGIEHSGPIWMAIVGNVARSAGGSMCLSPGARIDDGELKVSIIRRGPRSKLAMLSSLMPRVAAGEHIKDPSVSYFAGKRVEIDSDPPALVDLDGDLYGITPATFAVCPHAVQIMTPDEQAGGGVC